MTLLVTLIIVVAVAAAIIGYRLSQADTAPAKNPGEQVVCTMEAKQCADGSYVGRTGPSCEFAACPGELSSTGVMGINQTATVAGVVITPIEVLEDSRCPTDVQCIQAGTVRVKARIAQETYEFTLGTAQVIGGSAITLTQVSPSPISTSTISNSAYRFTFVVTP